MQRVPCAAAALVAVYFHTVILVHGCEQDKVYRRHTGKRCISIKEHGRNDNQNDCSNVEFYVLLTVQLGIICVNKQLDAQFFFIHVYFYSLHVSGSRVPIIRRINCMNTTSGTRCRFDTINSPDDEHMAARNMQRIEINIHEKELCVRLVIYKDYSYMG